MDSHGNRCILMKTCWGSPWPQHTGFYSTTYSGLDSSLHVNGFLSESDKDYPSLHPWLWRNCRAPYKTTYCWLCEEQGVKSEDEIIWNKFLIWRLEKVHPVPPQGPVTSINTTGSLQFVFQLEKVSVMSCPVIGYKWLMKKWHESE